MLSLLKTQKMLEILNVLCIQQSEWYVVADFIQLNLNQQQLMYRLNSDMELKRRLAEEGSKEWLNLTRYQPC